MTAPRTPVEPLARAHTIVTACSGCPELRYDSANFYECAKLGRSFKAPGKPTAPPAWCPLPLYPATLATPLAVQATDEREAIFRAAATAMPHTNPEVWRDWAEGHNVHMEPDDIIAIWQAGYDAAVSACAALGWQTVARAQLAQAPAALTEGQIAAIRDDLLPSQGEPFDCIAFARAIERAHGIGISHKEKDE